MLPALSQVCSLHGTFQQDVEDYAAGQCRALEAWLTKLEVHVQQHSAEHARDLLEQHGMTAPVASFQGGLWTRAEEPRQEAWSLFTRRLELCRRVGIRLLVVAGDFAAPITHADFDRLHTSLQQAAARAGEYGVRLALEFQAGAALANNLASAAALVAHAASPHLGLCLDAFHFHTGPSKTEDLGCLQKENLFHVQLCDLVGVPRELATDSDRILPGEGDIHLAPILARLNEIGYEQYVSIELLNPQIWQVPPRQFGEIGMTALRRFLGQASMGEE